MDISICIVSHNTRDILDECLCSIARHKSNVGSEVFVVDNASADCSSYMVLLNHPWVKLMANSVNVGLAAANNQAIDRAKGEYVLFLNSDVVVKRGALQALVDFMNTHPEVGAVGCKLVNSDDTCQNSVRRFPSFRTAFYEYTPVKFAGVFRKEYEAYKMEDFSYSTVCPVDQVMGAALMVRRNALKKIGPFPDYFLFYEDVDICSRLWRAGYPVYFFPGAEMVHKGGASMEKARAHIFKARVQSLLRFLEKREGRARMPVFRLFFKPLFIVRLLLDVLLGSLDLMRRRIMRQESSRIQRRINERRARLGMLRTGLLGFLFSD